MQRRGRGGAQLPVLRGTDQLRHAVESDAGGTAHRPHRPPRPGAPDHPHRLPALRRHDRDDVYRVLRDRIGLFQSVVGRLQPILAQLPRTITAAVLAGSGRDSAGYANALQDIELQTRAVETGGFDLDAVLDEDLAMPARSPAPVTMEDLDRVIRAPHVMPLGTEVRPLGPREYGLLAPGNAGPPARHHRSRLLRSGTPRAWSSGPRATPCSSRRSCCHPATELPADATGTLRDLLDLQMKEMTAMSRGGILRAGHSLPLRGFFGDYGVVVEHRMRDAWRGLP